MIIIGGYLSGKGLGTWKTGQITDRVTFGENVFVEALGFVCTSLVGGMLFGLTFYYVYSFFVVHRFSLSPKGMPI